MDRKKLFIPGPVDVADDVLAAMSHHMISHRVPECAELQGRCAEKMQKLMFTKNPIIFSTSSGTGLMESSIRSCTKKRAVVFSVGAFGNRWFEIAQGNNVPADKHEVEWGTPNTPELVDQYLSTGKYDVIALTHNETSTGIMNPVYEIAEVMKKYPDVVWLVDAVSSLGGAKIEADKLGIDILISSSQKALGVPPGLAVCSVSDKAIERARTVENRGYYFDLVQLYKYAVDKPHQYPSTPSVSHLFALDVSLDHIFKEGLDNVFKRHEDNMRFVRQWAAKHFELFIKDEKIASRTVTTIKNTKEADLGALSKELKKRGYIFSNGYGKMKGVSFRVAHMAERTQADIKEYLETIEDILGL
ncbi:MAG TPA: alanine--glyoxylate aminotransferase family protein [Firmicutes bacterium]|nr:alanine--glyoxylate aminotransferase family protein [Bacillota bacterium]